MSDLGLLSKEYLIFAATSTNSISVKVDGLLAYSIDPSEEACATSSTIDIVALQNTWSNIIVSIIVLQSIIFHV